MHDEAEKAYEGDINRVRSRGNIQTAYANDRDPRDASPTSTANDVLSQSLDLLDKEVSELTHRLEHVLRPNYAETLASGSEVTRGEPVAPKSPLVETLNSHAFRVAYAVDNIRDLANRLDV